MSLKGRTILITRQREQSAEFVAEVEKRGGRAVVIPMIQIEEPDSWEQCDVAIEALHTYSGLIFTSRSAVENFFRRCERKNVFSPSFATIEVYAVGARTAELLKGYGLSVTFTPQEFNSASLQNCFRGEHVSGKRLLFPKGNLSKEELPELLRSLGAVVDECDVYKNCPPTAETLQNLSERFLHFEFDVVTFASPSAIRNFHSAVNPSFFGMICNHTKLAVIGPTTRAAAEELGFHVDIEAEEATSEGLVDAIAEFYVHLNPET